MAKKYRRLFKYGELTKAVLKHIIDSVLAGYSTIEGRKGPGLSDIISSVDYLFKVIKKENIKQAK